MKTYKKGISLIVLVITVIVLAILATTVIISLSNTNIISEARKATFKSDMQGYKEMYTLYLADKLAVDKTLNTSEINAVYGDDTFTKIFGDNVPEKYSGLMIEEGKIYFSTTDESLLGIVEELGMVKVEIVPTVGELVNYTPNGSETAGPYEEANHLSGDGECTNDDCSDAYYTRETLTWVYLGKNSDGKHLLISSAPTQTIMNNTSAPLGGAYTEAIPLLYSNTDFGTARSIQPSDFELLGATYQENELTYEVTGLSDENYELMFGTDSSFYKYFVAAEVYKVEGDDEYWEEKYHNRTVNNGKFSYDFGYMLEYWPENEGSYTTMGSSYPVRPVIVLNENVSFGTYSETTGWELKTN